jgi:hypothetical protein
MADLDAPVSEVDLAPSGDSDLGVKPVLGGIPGRRVQESDGAYPCLVMVSDKLRVINCRDDMQWIIQRRQGADEWRGVSYCRTREALIRDARRRLGADLPLEGPAILQALPERHP